VSIFDFFFLKSKLINGFEYNLFKKSEEFLYVEKRKVKAFSNLTNKSAGFNK